MPITRNKLPMKEKGTILLFLLITGLRKIDYFEDNESVYFILEGVFNIPVDWSKFNIKVFVCICAKKVTHNHIIQDSNYSY